jgi:RNA recognition motif-containing protein
VVFSSLSNKHAESNFSTTVTLKVTNIPDTTSDALEKVFSAYGKVVSSTVRPNFAFVNFASNTNLATLLQKIADKPVVLQGRTLSVSEKKPQGQQQNRGGRGPRRESPVEPLDVSFNPEEYDSGHLLAE